MAGLTTSVLSAGASLFSIGSGIIQQNEAEKALDSLQTPVLENPYKNMSISTAGSDLLKEEGQRRTANVLDSLRGGGARNTLGALPSLVAMNDSINQRASLDIDNQMRRREYAVADYEGQLNNIEENRYQNDIAGIGSMYNMGQHQMWNGINSGIASFGSLGRALDDNKAG